MSTSALPQDAIQAIRPSLADRAALRVLWRCYGYLRPDWHVVAGAYLAAIAINLLNVAMPQLIRGIIDRGLTGGDIAFAGQAALGLLREHRG